MIIFDVLKAPKMTEKTLSLKEETNQYAFEVDPRANKIQIKDCVEKTFKVSVMNVRTMNCLLYTSPSPRDGLLSRMPSSA